MDSAHTSFGFTGMRAAVLRELRGERRGAAGDGLDPADRFVASGAGSPFFAHHLRPLREASPAAGPQAEPIRRDDGPDTYLSRQAPSIIRRTFETTSGITGPADGEQVALGGDPRESARGLQREPGTR